MKTCLQLFVTFLNIGAFTLGGGYAMLEMVEKAIVERKKWIEKDDFWDLITIIQSLPGVFAVNTALYIGYKIKGLKGDVSACLGAVIPSIEIILLLAIFITDYKDYETIKKIFNGIRPCVVALILSPAIKMFLSSKTSWFSITLPIVTVFLTWWCKVSPAYIILASIAGSVAFAFHSQKKLQKNDKS